MQRQYLCYAFIAIANICTLPLARAENERSEELYGAEQATEKIEISGSVVASGYPLYGSTSYHWQLDDRVGTPVNLADLLAQAPGVNVTGSGGLMQTISIRGIGGLGNLMLLGGIPISTNRRAGTGLHFLDPALLGDMELLSGPASAVYGSGALGGAVLARPKYFAGTETQAQYDSNGQGQHLSAGVGTQTQSIGLAHFTTNNSESADGTELNDHATRTNLIYQGNAEATDGHWSWLLAPAWISDMGRVANEARITTQPRETHLPMRLSYQHNSGVEASTYFYRSESLREITEPDQSRLRTDDSADNAGLNVHKKIEFDDWQQRFGVELANRHDVKASETSIDLDGNQIERIALPAGNEWIASAFFESEWKSDILVAQGGLRYSALRQSAQTYDDVTDNAVNGHLSLSLHRSLAFAPYISVSDGLRFPMLSERYYNGVTPRGTTLGNADLKPEHARAKELGFYWRAGEFNGGAHIYRQDIDDYIERVRLLPRTPRRDTYQNLKSGTIKGIEADVRWQAREELELDLNYSRVRGKDNNGDTLTEMPADRWRLNANWQLDTCSTQLGFTYRKENADVNIDELELGSARILSLAGHCEWNQQWWTSLSIDNARDEQWRLNNDSNAGFARGRSYSFAIGVRY